MEITDRKLIIGLIIIQIMITLPFINSFPIDLDEPFSIFYAQQELTEFIPFLNKGNNVPLHYILLHYWIDWFGINPISVRSLSLIFSVVTLPFVYLLSKKIISKPIAVVVSLLLIFSNYFHYQSLEARVYALFLLLFIVIVYYLYLIIFENRNVYFQIVIFSTLFLYSHYLAVMVLPVLLIVTLVFYKKIKQKQWIFIVLSGCCVILFYIPMLWLMFNRLDAVSVSGTWVVKPHWTEIYGNIVKFFNGKWSVMAFLILVIFSSIINFQSIRSRFSMKEIKPNHWFVLLIFLFTYFTMYLISILYSPIFLDKYLMFLSPILFVLVGILINFIVKNEHIKYSFVFVLPLLLSFNFKPDTNRDGDEIANYVKLNRANDLKIFICPPFYEFTFIYNYDKTLFADYGNYKTNLEMNNIHLIYNVADLPNEINNSKIVYIDCNSSFLLPNNSISDTLNQRFRLIEKKEFKGDYVVSKYEIND
jgi:uncharacterized membrane protein